MTTDHYVKAAVVTEAGSPPVIEEVELSPPQPGEVMVRIAATGICHTDIAWAAGELFPQFPVILGHESAGVVEEVGSGVERVKPGDRVGISIAHHCGHCFDCDSGHPMLCREREEMRPRFFKEGEPLVQGFGTAGFSEATVLRESSVIPLPDGIPIEVAAVTGCAVATGLGAALNIAQVRPGASVLVLGSGGIGACVVMGAKVAGAERIVVADPLQERRDFALRLGATNTVEPNEELLREFAPDGFEYVFECTGKTEPMELAVRLTRRGGTATLIGATPPDAVVTLNALDLVGQQKRVLGCLTGDLQPNVDFDRYYRLYDRGLLDFDALISSSLPLSDIARGFERAAAGEGIRHLVLTG